MQFWSEHDAREQAQKLAAREHREALARQLEEIKASKKQNKLRDIADTQKVVYGQSLVDLAAGGGASSQVPRAGPANSGLGNGNGVGTTTSSGNYVVTSNNGFQGGSRFDADATANRYRSPSPLQFTIARNGAMLQPASDFKMPPLPAIPFTSTYAPSFTQQQPRSSSPGTYAHPDELRNGSGTDAAGNDNSDLYLRLKMTEDQLLQEQRVRQQLDQELQQQKSLILTLTAQFNTLQSSLASDSTALHDLTRHLDAHDRKMDEFTQETVGKVRLHENFIKQLMADVAARSKYGEEARRGDENKFRALTEEMQQLKYKLEHFNLEASKADQELYFRTKELEDGQNSGMDIKNIIKDHDITLDMIQKNWNNRHELFARKMQEEIGDLRQRITVEASTRDSAVKHTEDLFEDVKDMIALQEKELLRHVDTVKDSLKEQANSDVQALEKRIDGAFVQLQHFEKMVGEREKQALRRSEDVAREVLTKVADETTQRQQAVKQLKHDIDMMARAVGSGHQKSVEILENSINTIKNDMNKAVRKTQESVGLVEREISARLSNTEEVLRAEIKSRLDSESKIKESVNASAAAVHSSVSADVESKVRIFVASQQALATKLDMDLRQTAQQAVDDLRSGTLRAIENEISALRKHVKDVEVAFDEKQQLFQGDMEQLREENKVVAEMNGSERQVAAIADQWRSGTEELHRRIAEIESKLLLQRQTMDERLALRQRQVDQTFLALKEAVDSRVPRTEYEKQHHALEAELLSKTRVLRDKVQTLTTDLGKLRVETSEHHSDGVNKFNQLYLFKERADKELFEFGEWQRTFDARLDALGTSITGDIKSRLFDNEGKLVDVKRELGDDLKPVVEALAIQVTDVRAQLSKQTPADQFDAHTLAATEYMKSLTKKNDDLAKTVADLRERLLAVDGSMFARQQQMHTAQEKEIDDNWKLIKAWKEATRQRLDAVEQQLAAYFGEDRLRRPDGSDGGKGALRKELAIAKHEVTKEVATAQQHIDAELLELRRELSNIKTQESSLESRTLAIVQNLETRIDRIIQFQHEQNAAITAASDEFERERKTEKPVVPDANGAPERPIQQSPSGNMDHTVLIEKLNDIAAYSAYDPDQTQSAFGGVDHSAMITPEVGNSPMVQRVSKVYRPVSLPSAMPQVAPNGVTPGLLTPVPGSHHASGAFFLNNIIGAMADGSEDPYETVQLNSGNASPVRIPVLTAARAINQTDDPADISMASLHNELATTSDKVLVPGGQRMISMTNELVDVPTVSLSEASPENTVQLVRSSRKDISVPGKLDENVEEKVEKVETANGKPVDIADLGYSSTLPTAEIKDDLASVEKSTVQPPTNEVATAPENMDSPLSLLGHVEPLISDCVQTAENSALNESAHVKAPAAEAIAMQHVEIAGSVINDDLAATVTISADEPATVQLSHMEQVEIDKHVAETVNSSPTEKKTDEQESKQLDAPFVDAVVPDALDGINAPVLAQEPQEAGVLKINDDVAPVINDELATVVPVMTDTAPTMMTNGDAATMFPAKDDTVPTMMTSFELRMAEAAQFTQDASESLDEPLKFDDDVMNNVHEKQDMAENMPTDSSAPAEFPTNIETVLVAQDEAAPPLSAAAELLDEPVHHDDVPVLPASNASFAAEDVDAAVEVRQGPKGAAGLDYPTEGPDTTTEGQEVPTEVQEGAPTEDQDFPMEDQDFPMEVQEGAPTEGQEVPMEVQEVPMEVQEGAPTEFQEGAPTEDQEVPMEGQDIPMEDPDVPTEDQHPTDNVDATTISYTTPSSFAPSPDFGEMDEELRRRAQAIAELDDAAGGSGGVIGGNDAPS